MKAFFKLDCTIETWICLDHIEVVSEYHGGSILRVGGEEFYDRREPEVLMDTILERLEGAGLS